MTAELKYPRILLKLSGEALAGDKGFGYDFDAVGRFGDDLRPQAGADPRMRLHVAEIGLPECHAVGIASCNQDIDKRHAGENRTGNVRF